MLPEDYKLQIENKTGSALSGTASIVDIQQWKFDADGALAYRATAEHISSTSLADAAFDTGSVIDNGTNLDIGAHVTMTIKNNTSTGPTGDQVVNCYLMRSADDGTTFDDDGRGALIGVVSFTAANQTKSITVEI